VCVCVCVCVRTYFVVVLTLPPVFMDEIDAIGGKRFSEGSSADREIQRTLMELLNQMDGWGDLLCVQSIC
jgi:ATP-dependent 26S proteasome regulatory subunit